MEEFIKEIVEWTLTILSGIIIVAFLAGTFYLCSYITFKLDKRMCKVFVNNELVYTGRNYFIRVTSIGENGNTKTLNIYDGLLCNIPKATYVHNDIVIESINK